MKDFSLKKLYYSISEVSKLTDLEQYILRYWETEFEQLKPGKNRAGNRIYTNKDIQLIMEIKKLLREEKYTIDGAKNILASGGNHKTEHVTPEVKNEIKESTQVEKRDIQKDFEEIKNFLVDLRSKF